MEGNQMKIREALDEILLVCYKAGARYGYDVACGLIKAKAKNALSVPNRNCDVGTAEEQADRFYDHCLSFKQEMTCDKCPLVDSKPFCEFAWAQMPYEAQEGAQSENHSTN